MPIRILVDIRENDLLRELEPYSDPSGAAFWVEKTTLDVGDIAFVSDISGSNPYVVLERKTAEDLGASQRDGRYREQRARLYALRGSGTAIGYILEAPPWSPSLNRSWCRGAFTEVHLQQTIARLQFRHTIPVFQSASIPQTVQWIRRIATALHNDPTVYSCAMATSASEAAAVYTEAIHVKKAENNSPQRIFISFLLAIPGLGKATAEAIGLAVNYSFTTLQSKTLAELSEIQGGKKRLGNSLATAIHAAIHS
jgi:ERCC4-type nuclease